MGKIAKLPPNDIYAEQSVLSSILINSDYLAESTLLPEHFYKPAHINIYESILSLSRTGNPVDIISVSDELKRIGKLESVGGITYLSNLIDSTPISPNIEYHCKIIKEKSDLRKLINVSSVVINKCYDGGERSVEILEESQKQYSDIGEQISDKTNASDLLLDVFKDLEELKDTIGSMSGIPTGFRDFDKHTSGLQDTDFILIGARPSMGKTALMLNMIKRAAVNCYPVLVFSLEMSKKQLIHRLLSDLSSSNLMKFKSGNFSDSDWSNINSAATKISEMNIHIIDTPGLSVEQIISISRKMQMKHGIKAIYIDYIQLIKGWSKEGQAPKVEISWSLKLIAKSLNIPLIALSQLNRSLESRAGDKRPIISDLRDSGALEQDADMIVFLYRDEVYNKDPNNPEKGTAEIIIRKNRQGSIGTVKVGFIPEYTRFYDFEIGGY